MSLSGLTGRLALTARISVSANSNYSQRVKSFPTPFQSIAGWGWKAPVAEALDPCGDNFTSPEFDVLTVCPPAPTN